MEARAESPVKKALALISELEGRLAAFERERSEPIAVVGLGCRFPGNVNTPEEFWQMLKQGRSALTPVPPQRFDQQRLYDPDPAAVGKLYVRNGYFLDAIDRFDAPFFGISPREAEQMDPQQRLLLEVAWEALERAAQPWARLRDSKTGVFVGIANYDYAQMIFSRRDYAKIDSFSGTGNSFSFLTGRLSYLLGLQGPSVAIDTACSSSLVAIHLACASLRSGESDCALAGGVQIVASPIPQLFLCRSQALSADGTCKAFAAGADGYGRGEGCGIVVLKRLSDALRERDQIWGIIRTSAVNHDGASSGLTVPNPRAQVRVLQTALRSAAIEPESIAYVEAHGVGTPIGDPIEMRSIASVLGVRRTHPIYVGSAKTNIGHLEGAAGIAGFIKTLLAVHHGEIPRNLHFDEQSSQIDWASMNVAVPTAHLPWPDPQLPRRAAVNAFGLSGTNAHVVIESAPPNAASRATAGTAESEAESPYFLPLSAKSQQALDALSARYRDFLQAEPEVSLADVCYSAATGRAHSNQRAALVAPDRAGMVAALDALLAGRPGAGTHTGRVPTGLTPRAAFMYTGQGAQYPGMGRALYAAYPAFRRTIDRCDAVLREPALLGRSIRELMLEAASSDGDPYRSTLLAQTALFSFEMALTELWRSWGINPDVLLGHSLGEYAAACAAGVFELEDGLRLLVARGKLVASLTQEGRMATVFASEAALLPHLQPFAGSVGIAAINGPEILVLSGVAAAMDELLPRLSAAGVRTVPLAIAQAFHSPLVEPILADFRRAAEQVRFSSPHTTLLSNLSDDGRADPLVATPEYWVRHLRHTVRFYDCLCQLHREKFEIFVEIGPEPVLLAFDQCLPESVGAPAEADVLWLPSVRRELPERQQMLESLGALYSRGFEVDWPGVYAGEERQRVAAPTYPFEDRRYWAIADSPDEPRELRVASSASGVTALLENQDVAALLGLVEARQPLSSEARAAVGEALRVLAEHHRALTAPSRLEDATYGIEWQPRPLPASDASASVGQGPWLLFGEPGEAPQQIAAQLEQRGASCIFVSEGAEYRRTSARSFTVRSSEPADLRRLFAELEAELGQAPLGGALVLWPELGAEQSLEQCEAIALRLSGLLLHLLQATHDLPWAREARLWALTRGAVCTGGEPASELMPFGAPLWGAAKVAGLEYPRLWGGIIDSASPLSAAEEAARIVAEIASRSGEDQVALRGSARLVPRLVKTRLSEGTYRFDPSARYVITGGLGFLGLAIADWIVAQGVRHLTLVSRREADDAIRTRMRGLAAAGASVEHVRADVTDSEAMRALFDARQRPVRGIFHLAGSAGFIETAKLPLDRFLSLVAPKITGTRVVHEAAKEQPLDFFFCSSSLSSIWGYKGGFHYAAANAFLDSFMLYRRASGQPGLAVNIGPCSGGGVAEPQFLELLEKVGVVPITSDLVTDALSHLLATLEPTMVAKMNWPTFTELYEAQRPSPFLSEMREHAAGATAESVSQAESAVLRELLAAPRSQRRELLTRALQREVVDVLRLPAGDEPDPRLGFFSMGMNSIMVMELRARVQRAFKVDLAATLVFNKPTIAELTEHLLVTLPGLSVEAAPPEPARAVQAAVTLAPLATETLDELSEDELERMLDRTLDALPGVSATQSTAAELEAAAGRS